MSPKFERKLLTSVISVSLAASALPVYAQDNDQGTVEEVVVTGIRTAIRNALEEKREETSIVEAISAEDIGKLPDISIAESIARLPGLAAQRTRGRAQVISVRGLGPDFTTALLNGREQVTAGDNRGVEFDQYPAELMSQAVIYKTPDAALIGQAIGGTVDLRTIRPLAYGNRAINLNARYELNDQGSLNAGSNDDGYRLTGSYINQFADETVGLAVGFATQSAPTQAERWDAWGYPDVDGDLVIGGAKPYVESRDLERDAFVGTLEFEPNDSFRLVADAFYSDFKDGGILRGIEFPLHWSGASLQPGYSASNGLITNGVYDGVQGVVRNDTRSREAELTSFGVNAEWRMNDAWTFEADLSTSSADRDDIDFETYSGTGAGFGTGASDSLGFNITGGGRFEFDSQLNYDDPNLILLTDPQGWGQVGFIKEPSIDDELDQVRLQAERIFEGDFIDSVEFGVNFTSRDKDKTSIEAFVDLANPSGDNTSAVPSDLQLGSTQLDFLGIPGQLSYNPESLLAAGLYSLRSLENIDVLQKSWNVNEDILNVFAMVNIDTQWGDIPVRGNFGVQWVDAEQESTGPSVEGGVRGIYTDSADYDHLLPALNLTFELNENTYARFGAAKTIMRPRMDDMRATREVGFDSGICGFDSDGNPQRGTQVHDPANSQSCISISGGNAQLEPYEATSFDVSLEHYFPDEVSNVALALFYKDIDAWILNDGELFDVTGEVSALFGSQFLADNPELGVGVRNAPINTQGGDIQGVELSTNLSGGLISPALESFGIYASYTYNDAEITPKPGEDPINIPGFSEDIMNASIYFENDNWQARISMRDRDDFLGEVVGFGANRDFRDVNGENVVDAQFGYTFTAGALQGSSIILQAYNLTDEEFRTFLNEDPRQVKDWQRYGTSYILGFNYKF